MNSINWDQVVVDHMAHTKAPLPYRVIGKVVSTVSLFSNQLAGSYLNQLWFKPIGPKISDKDKAWLNQAQRHDFKHKGLNVPVYAWGEGPIVLAAHGWAGHAGQFRQMGEALVQQGFTFISFDAPAHGQAQGKETNLVEMAEVICKLATHYEEKNLHAIVGHSVAGLAITYALQEGLKPLPVIMVATPWSLDYVIKITASYMGINDGITSVLKNKIENNFGEGTRQRLCLNQYENPSPTIFFYDKNDDQVSHVVVEQVEQQLNPNALHLSESLGHNRIIRSGQTIDSMIGFLNQLDKA